MPDAPKPVTVGDLRVALRVGWSGDPFEDRDRPATVADLVSALRAEGVLKGDWTASKLRRLAASQPHWSGVHKDLALAALDFAGLIDALAEEGAKQ